LSAKEESQWKGYDGINLCICNEFSRCCGRESQTLEELPAMGRGVYYGQEGGLQIAERIVPASV